MKPAKSRFSAFIVSAMISGLIFNVGCQKDTVPTNVSNAPSLLTSAATNLTPTSAVSGGTITSAGSSEIIKKGVCFSISPNPDTNSSHTKDGSGTGAFTSSLTNLIPNTVYYARAYATNKQATGYGDAITFTTPEIVCEPSFTYEGKLYNTILINSQCWMKENLNAGTRINGNVSQGNNSTIEKYCYNDEESNCNFYGALYQWDEMMGYSTTPGVKGICPTGWHIPTDADWAILSDFLGGDSIAGGKIKQAGFQNWAAPNTGATNSSGFTAFGGGNYTGTVYEGIMLFAYFWSSTQDNANTDYAWSRTPYSAGKDLYRGSAKKTKGFSVRCLKD